MKILFLNLPYKFAISRSSRWPEKTKSGTMYYPYWLCYAAGVCMDRGYDVELVDCIVKKNEHGRRGRAGPKIGSRLHHGRDYHLHLLSRL